MAHRSVRLLVAIGAFAALTWSIPPAYASTSFVYVSTGSPIPANTAYYDPTYLTHDGNHIQYCDVSFSAAIFLKTTGGSEIRRRDGNCSLHYDWAVGEASTRAWCYSKSASARYAQCLEWYQ
jgi:hypothetical protein